MDHSTAVKTMAVEKYLLDDLSSEERDDFENHFFCCDECARDIQWGSVLMAKGREIFAEEKTRELQHAPIKTVQPHRDWLAWLKPAFAVPVMALMLGVLVFQNAIQLPEMHRSLVAANSPALLPGTYLASGSARGDEHVVNARPGEAFQVTIDIPDSQNTARVAELYDAAGQKQWSLPIPADAPREGLSLKMPGDLPAGSYSLVVHGAGDTDASTAKRYAFSLHRS